MEFRSTEDQLEISELDPFLAELLRQIPASTKTECVPAAEQRLFSAPADPIERELCAEWKLYVQPELRRLFGRRMQLELVLRAQRERDDVRGCELQHEQLHGHDHRGCGRHVVRQRECGPVLVGLHLRVRYAAEPQRIAECATKLAGIDGISQVYSVSGEWDLVAMVEVAEHEEIARIVTEGITVVPGIKSTQTLTAFRAYSKKDLEQAWDIGLE